MRTKRINVSLLFAICIIAFALTACSGRNKTTEQPVNEETETVEEAGAIEETETVEETAESVEETESMKETESMEEMEMIASSEEQEKEDNSVVFEDTTEAKEIFAEETKAQNQVTENSSKETETPSQPSGTDMEWTGYY